MDKYIYDENNGLWYERCGDYYSLRNSEPFIGECFRSFWCLNMKKRRRPSKSTALAD